MSWLTPDQNNAPARDERYLRVPDPQEEGESCKAIIRFVDESPVPVWRHWVNNRPLNCPGFYQGCPICKERKAEEARDPKGFRNKFRMDRKWLANVLLLGYVDEQGNTEMFATPEEKIFAFGKELGETLEMFFKDKEYGDLRGYDVNIIKRRTGDKKWDVRYSAMPGKKYELSSEFSAIAENNKHDIQSETTPATREALLAALNGGTEGETGGYRVENSDGGNEPSGYAPTNNYASLSDVLELKAIAKEKGYDVSDFFPGKSEGEYDMMEVQKVKTTLARL